MPAGRSPCSVELAHLDQAPAKRCAQFIHEPGGREKMEVVREGRNVLVKVDHQRAAPEAIALRPADVLLCEAVDARPQHRRRCDVRPQEALAVERKPGALFLDRFEAAPLRVDRRLHFLEIDAVVSEHVNPVVVADDQRDLLDVPIFRGTIVEGGGAGQLCGGNALDAVIDDRNPSAWRQDDRRVASEHFAALQVDDLLGSVAQGPVAQHLADPRRRIRLRPPQRVVHHEIVPKLNAHAFLGLMSIGGRI